MTVVGVQRIVADDGVRLAAHRLGPETGPPVVLVPGTFSNATFWIGTRGVGFARALAEAGFDAWVLDTRGHGESQRPAPGERWTFDDWARRDLPAVIRAVRGDGAASSPPRRPLLVGHSAGGSAALAALAADPALRESVAGVVAIATPAPWLQPLRVLAARGIRRLSLGLGRFPARLLRLGPEDELPGVMAQWMSWNIQGRWTGLDGTDYGERITELSLPFLAIAGAGDRLWAPPRACRTLHDLVGGADRTYLLCGRETAFSRDFGHADVVVGRAARSEVWPRILEWLGARGARGRVGDAH